MIAWLLIAGLQQPPSPPSPLPSRATPVDGIRINQQLILPVQGYGPDHWGVYWPMSQAVSFTARCPHGSIAFSYGDWPNGRPRTLRLAVNGRPFRRRETGELLAILNSAQVHGAALHDCGTERDRRYRVRIIYGTRIGPRPITFDIRGGHIVLP